MVDSFNFTVYDIICIKNKKQKELKFSPIESVLVMNLLPKLMLFGNFCRREEFFRIAFFITDHVIFILFFYFIIKLEK